MFVWQIAAEKIVVLIFWIKKDAFETGKVTFCKSLIKSKLSKVASPWFLSKV